MGVLLELITSVGLFSLQLVIVMLLMLGGLALFRGHKTLAYGLLAGAAVCGVFLAGVKFQEIRCERLINQLEDKLQENTLLEQERQRQANTEIKKLATANAELTQQAAEDRFSVTEDAIAKIISSQGNQSCSGSNWSDDEFDLLRRTLEKRERGQGGN